MKKGNSKNGNISTKTFKKMTQGPLIKFEKLNSLPPNLPNSLTKTHSILNNKNLAQFSRTLSEKAAHKISILSSNNEIITMDPQTFLELKELDLQQLRKEKDENLRELKRVIDEIETLNFHFDKKYFAEKSVIREGELRNHIKNLGDRIYTRDVEIVKGSMKDLHEEISINVRLIEEKMKEEILDKKKDIENRINIRLMDAEFKHKKTLEEKVQEQETMLRSLNSVTSEMLKIKENYEKIKKRIEVLFYANNQIKKKIKDEKMKNENFKLEMKRRKIILRDLVNQVKGNEKVENEIEKIASRTQTESVITSSNFNSTNKLFHHLNTVSSVSSIIPNATAKNSVKNNKDPERTIQILINTLNTYKSKVNKIKTEQNTLTSTGSKLNKRVYEILNQIKSASKDNPTEENILQTHTTRNNQLTATNTINSYLYTVENYSSYEDRKRFLDKVTRDKSILEVIKDEKFPTINITHRNVKSQK